MEEEAPTTLEKGTLQRLRQITKILVRHGFFDIVQRMKLLEYVPLSSRLLSNKFKEERKIPRKVRLRLVLTEGRHS